MPTIDSYEDWLALEPYVRFIPRDVVLELCVRLSHWVPGHIIEFGVYRGTSTRILRRTLTRCKLAEFGSPAKKIYACDSFEGLPEKFAALEPGAFVCDPPKIRGVRIVKGFFEDSLTSELAKEVGRVSCASLDADLHSSTKCVLDWLTPLLGTGSLLLFDQFLGDGGQERRAFEDWSRENGMRTIMIGKFMREPSGLGPNMDMRVLFQVVGPEKINPIPEFWHFIMKVKRRLGIGFAP